MLWVTLVVDEQWKGEASDTIRVLTAQNEGICGYTFIPDLEYLVYAQDGALAPPGIPSVQLCWRTHLLDAGDPDLDLLGASYPMEAGRTTWGALKVIYR